MTPTGTPLLSWGWLSHSGDESEPVLLLSARPVLDRFRDVRRLDTLTPRQIRDRARQLQHPMTLAPALRTFGVALQVPVYAARSGSSAEHLHCTACAAWCRAGVHLLSLHTLSRYVDPFALA